MALLGACWTVTGVLTLLSPPADRSPVMGLLLLFASAVLLVPHSPSNSRTPGTARFCRCCGGEAADGPSTAEPAQARNVEHEAGVREQL
jgi:hypothetical protein